MVRYFFLFDDFALVGESSTVALRDLLGQPLFGFYRPVPFVFVKAAFATLGWGHPAGYLALSFALHTMTSLLLLVLVRRTSGSVAGAAAATLFWLAPASTEATFWLSGAFDITSTFFLVTALAASLTALDGRGGRKRTAFIALSLTATALALLCKESAVVLPFVFLFVALAERRHSIRSILRIVVAIVLVVAAYAAIRSSVLPVLGGAYGDYPSLMKSAGLQNVPAFVGRAFAFPLLETSRSFTPVARTLGLAAGWVAIPVLLALAAWSSPRLAGFAVASFLVSLFPVAWCVLSPGHDTTAGGRLLYLPSVWITVLLARGVAEPGDRPFTRLLPQRAVRMASATIVLAYATMSIVSQSVIWRSATGISRTAVKQMVQVVESGRPVYVDNLPFLFVEGPYVLKSYAFRYYYQRPDLAVRARRVTLQFSDGPYVVASAPDETSSYSVPATAEIAVHLWYPTRPVSR